MKKRSRYFTLMVIPHSEEATYSVRLPLLVGQIVVATLAVCLAGILILVFCYRNALVDAREVRELREANQILQDELNTLGSETIEFLQQIQSMSMTMEDVAEKVGVDMGNSDTANGDAADEGESDTSMLNTETATDRTYAARLGNNQVLDRTAGNVAFLKELLPEKEDSLNMLNDEVDEYLRRLAATPTGWPTRGYFTSGFGMRRDPLNRSVFKFHTGVDIAGAHGTAIWATADGVISSASYRGGYGNLVIIDHGYGFVTYYAHLSGFAVSSGKWVKRGQVIGYMGRTGRVTGTHLHYEVHVNGVPVNPLNYM